MLVAWLQNICWHVIYVDVPVCEGLGCCKKNVSEAVLVCF